MSTPRHVSERVRTKTLVRFVLVVVLGASIVLNPLIGGSSDRVRANLAVQANQPPSAGPIVSTAQSGNKTWYEITATDPDGDPLDYDWDKIGNHCGSFAQDLNDPHKALWDYSTQDCPSPPHTSTIFVDISDGDLGCSAEYDGGTLSGTGDDAECDSGVSPAPSSPAGASPSEDDNDGGGNNNGDDDSDARFIELCHGDVAVPCLTTDQTNEPNDEHEMTARVTDAQGDPVAGVPVEFRETGPGIFTPQGGSVVTVLTDSKGLASILLTSDVQGESTVTAEIKGGSGPAGTRGSGLTDDACEQPAGFNGSPAAGNCLSRILLKLWDITPPSTPECDDGQDNDGDTFIDEEDPGCSDGGDDDSELPVNPPPLDRHPRSISIRFNDGTGARNNGLVVFGRLRAPGFPDCRSSQPVNIQRRVNGRWVTRGTTRTLRRGRFAVEIFDLASRYRAVAPRVEIPDVDLNQVDICRKAIKAKRHRHRR